MFSDFWSENAALFERLMKIHSNSPILHVYYGFNVEVHFCIKEKGGSSKMQACKLKSMCFFDMKLYTQTK